jgi:hypothetical protein
MDSEKTYAREQCTGNWLIQLDADEIIQEPKPGFIRELIKKNRNADVIDLPCINFYKDDKTIRVEDNCWKWRISKNDPNIIHGVFGKARVLDPETMKITMDKKVSDGCEYIYRDSLDLCKHKIGFPGRLIAMHEALKRDKSILDVYIKELAEMVKNYAVVFHYSWFDLNRKKKAGEFWDQTYHGKQNKTHNTTKDIAERIEKSEDFLVQIPFDHPFKGYWKGHKVYTEKEMAKMECPLPPEPDYESEH